MQIQIHVSMATEPFILTLVINYNGDYLKFGILKK
jgi:hypothetical protein